MEFAKPARQVARLALLASLATGLGAATPPFDRFATLGPPTPPAEQVVVHPLEGRLLYLLVPAENLNASVLYRSLDGGTTWSIAQNGLQYPARVGASRFVDSEIVVDPRYPGVAYLIQRRFPGLLLAPPELFVYRTIDHGASWVDVHSQLDPFGLTGGLTLYFPPSAPRMAWAQVSSVGLPRYWRSRNAGDTWFLLHDSLPELAFEPPPPLVRYRVSPSANQVERSDDGGLTWRATGTTPYHPVSISAVIGGSPDGRAYLATSDLVGNIPPAGVFRSDDSGATWRQVNEGLGDLRVPSLAAAQDVEGVVAAAGPAGLFVSSDGGGSWRVPRAGIGRSVRDVAVVASGGTSALLAGDQRSTDGGASWSPVPELAGSDADFAVEHGGAVAYALVPQEAGSPGQLWRSADAGASFQRRDAARCHAVAVPRRDPGAASSSPAPEANRTARTTLAAADVEPVFCLESVGSPAELVLRRSTDGGVSFTELQRTPASTELTPVSVADLEAGERANGTLRVVAAANLGTPTPGLPWLRVSDDGGATWAASDLGLAEGAFVFDVLLAQRAERIVLATSAGVLASTDGGGTWQLINRGLELAGQIHALGAGSSTGALYAGSGRALYRSRNDGATWQRFDDGARGPQSHRIEVVGGEASETIYAATSHGLLARSAGATCVSSDVTMCLLGGDFRVEMTWAGFDAGSGPGHAREITSDTGTFWFFDPGNVEIVIKVLDGCAINDHQWVFLTGLTDVETDLRVTRVSDGASRRYFRPMNAPFPPVLEIEAFPCR